MSSSNVDSPPVWNVGSFSGALPTSTTVTGGSSTKSPTNSPSSQFKPTSSGSTRVIPSSSDKSVSNGMTIPLRPNDSTTSNQLPPAKFAQINSTTAGIGQSSPPKPTSPSSVASGSTTQRNPLRSPRMARLPSGLVPIQSNERTPQSAPVQASPSSSSYNNATSTSIGTILPVVPSMPTQSSTPVTLSKPIKFSEMAMPTSAAIDQMATISRTTTSGSILSPPSSPRSNIVTPFDDVTEMVMMDPLSSGPSSPAFNQPETRNNSGYGIGFSNPSLPYSASSPSSSPSGGISFSSSSGVNPPSSFQPPSPSSFGITFQTPTTSTVFAPSNMMGQSFGENNFNNSGGNSYGISFTSSSEPKRVRRFVKPVDKPVQSTKPVQQQSMQQSVIQFPKIIGSIPMMDYNSMTAEMQSVYRADFRMKLKALHSSFPELNLESGESMEDLYTLHAIYERNIHLILTVGNIDSGRNWLVLFWMFVEFLGWKVGLPAVGYTTNQIAKADSYRTLMLQLGERSYNTIGRGWPVEFQIVVMAGKQLIFFMAYKLLSKFMADNNAQHVVDKLEGFLTKPMGVARSSDPNSPVPPPPVPSSSGTFGGLFNTFFGGNGGSGFTGALSAVGGLFGGGGGQDSTVPAAGSASTSTATATAAPARASRFRPQVARDEGVKLTS